MKTIFTLLLATSVSTAALAANEGRLTITVAANKNVMVTVDGRQYSDDDNSFVLDNIQPGNHTIRIYKMARNGNGRNANNRNKKDELVYSGTIYVRPSTHVDIMVNRFGKALVDERAIHVRDRWEDEDRDEGGYGNGNYDEDYNRAMSDHEFSQLLQKIRSAWFNSGKMTAAKDAFQRNHFTTSQVRQVLQLFSTESDKLELARLSYGNIVDKRSFYQLYDLFSFQSSKDELERHVRNYESRF